MANIINPFAASDAASMENFNLRIAAINTGAARRAASPTNGNLAALNADGDPTDSGKKASDFAAVSFYTATLTASGWVGSSAPYTQTLTVSGVASTNKPVADVVLSDTPATAQSQLEAWGMVGRIVTGTNQITATCYSDKPTVDIPIQLMVVR